MSTVAVQVAAVEAPWYAVRTRSNQEASAAQRLATRGIEAFVPTVTAVASRRDRYSLVSRPLFRGYFFVSSDLSRADRVGILSTRGVVGLVGFQAGPVAIPSWQIGSLRVALASRSPLEVLNKLVAGRRVRLAGGPLMGVEGVVVRAPDGADRLVISVELLGRSVSLKLPSNQVEPV